MFNKFLNLTAILFINLRRNWVKELFIGFGIILALIVLITGNTITKGLKTVYEKSLFSNIPFNEIKIDGSVKTVIEGSIFNIREVQRKRTVHNISQQFINEIKTWEEVKTIYPITKALFPISVYVIAKPPIRNNETIFILEPPVVGIPEPIADKYIKQYSSKDALIEYKNNFPNGFKKHNGFIPVLIPRYLQDIGTSVMQANTFPDMNLSVLQNFFNLNILFNKSTFISSQYQNQYQKSNVNNLSGKIVGFSDLNLTAGIAIPQDELEAIKKTVLSDNESSGFESLIIRFKKDSNVKAFTQKVKTFALKHNIKVAESSLVLKLSEYIRSFIQYFELTIFIIGGTILLVSAISIFYAFSYLFIQRNLELGLYRFFGATNTYIAILTALEALIIGIFFAALGFILSYLITDIYIIKDSQSIMKLLPDNIKAYIFNQELKDIFKFYYNDNIIFIAIACLTSILSALSVAIINTIRWNNKN